MKIAVIVFASAVVVTGSAFGHSHRHHHHMRMTHGSSATSNPNGTPGGPTSLSGTGSSKFGGNIPGSPRATGQ